MGEHWYDVIKIYLRKGERGGFGVTKSLPWPVKSTLTDVRGESTGRTQIGENEVR